MAGNQSYVWRVKAASLHHIYANVYDDIILDAIVYAKVPSAYTEMASSLKMS